MDLKLDTSHDLVLVDGDLVLVDGAEAVKQDVDCRLRTFLGEWFLDLRIGVPYFEKILGQKPRFGVISAVFREVILGTPGMISIEDLTLDFDGATRLLSVSFRGTSTSGIVEYERELVIR